MNINGDSTTREKTFNPHPGCGCSMTAGLVILWFMGGIGIQLAFAAIKHTEDIMGPDLALAGFLYAFAFAAAFWAVTGQRDWLGEIGLRWSIHSPLHWLGGTASGFAAVGVALVVIGILADVALKGGPPAEGRFEEIGTWSWFWSIFLFALYAGEEEIILRGMVYPLLRRSIGVTLAVIISSLIFSSFHLLNNAISPIPVLDIFLAGVFLALMRELTGNIWLAWGAHFGWNFGLVMAGLPVSGYLARLHPQTWHVVTGGPVWVTGGLFGPEGGIGGLMANALLVVILVLLVVAKSKRDKLREEIPEGFEPAQPFDM